jgi:hypothetical protein
MPPALEVTDMKMLELIDTLKDMNIISTTQEFCDSMGIFKQNIVTVRKGLQSFRAAHIADACRIYNVNANWIYGFESNMFRKRVNKIVNSRAETKGN